MQVIQGFLLLLILALLPSLFWLFVFLRKDDHEPEPRRLLLKIFILGGLLVIPIVVIEFLANNYVFTTPESTAAAIWLNLILYVGLLAPIEEFGKYWIAKTVVLRNKKYFTQTVDGIIYMVVAAAGFAFVENFSYFIGNILQSSSLGLSHQLVGASLLNIFALRAIGATLMHFASSGILGYFWGSSWFKKSDKERTKTFLTGFFIAVLLHGVFNLSLNLTGLTNIEFGPIALILAAAGTIYLFYRFRHEENIVIHSISGGEKTAEATLEKPKNTTLLVVTMSILIIALIIILLGNNKTQKETYVYSIVKITYALENGRTVELYRITQTESLEQCNTVFETYRKQSSKLEGGCDGSLETNNSLSDAFSNKPAANPYISFVDSGGHEVRATFGNLSADELDTTLQVVKDGIEKDGFKNVQIIYPKAK